MILANQANQVEQALAGEGWLLLYYSASWCQPCQVFTPIVTQVGRYFEGALSTLKIDVEQLPEIAGAQKIRSVPTLQLFNNGQLVTQTKGAQPPQQVTQWLRQHIFYEHQ